MDKVQGFGGRSQESAWLAEAREKSERTETWNLRMHGSVSSDAPAGSYDESNKLAADVAEA
jgi:hypothetical protein